MAFGAEGLGKITFCLILKGEVEVVAGGGIEPPIQFRQFRNRVENGQMCILAYVYAVFMSL